MTLALNIATLLAVGLLLADRVHARRRPGREPASLRGRLVLAQLDTRQTIRGVVAAEYADMIALEHAEYVDGPNAAPIGQALLPRARIGFWQPLGDPDIPAIPDRQRMAGREGRR